MQRWKGSSDQERTMDVSRRWISEVWRRHFKTLDDCVHEMKHNGHKYNVRQHEMLMDTWERVIKYYLEIRNPCIAIELQTIISVTMCAVHCANSEPNDCYGCGPNFWNWISDRSVLVHVFKRELLAFMCSYHSDPNFPSMIMAY